MATRSTTSRRVGESARMVPRGSSASVLDLLVGELAALGLGIFVDEAGITERTEK